jgi:hypothetical protein
MRLVLRVNRPSSLHTQRRAYPTRRTINAVLDVPLTRGPVRCQAPAVNLVDPAYEPADAFA